MRPSSLIRAFSTQALLILTFQGVLANDNLPISGSFVIRDLAENDGVNLASLSRPLWHFGRSRGNDPCYPSSAFNFDGTQSQPADLKLFPQANGGGCPEVGPRGEGRPFPTYYTISYCGGDELRIQYSLFFAKDGFIKVVPSPCNGHGYDWERVIVVWKRNTTDDTWTRKQLLASFHKGYHAFNWQNIQSTINYDNITESHAKNKDGPKIFVGWAKHAMFTDRNTGWNDCFSQGCNREFRSNDWWYLPRTKDMINASANSTIGKHILGHNWGAASSPPPVVEQRICGEKDGRNGPECLSLCEEMEGLGRSRDADGL